MSAEVSKRMVMDLYIVGRKKDKSYHLKISSKEGLMERWMNESGDE